MVLLIPDAIRKIKEAGRKEQREAQQKRRKQAYERFGFEVDGVVVLPQTPEVEAFLNGDEPPADNSR
ncbi:MAG: hypothetical protein F4X65_00065 [Chloroflexi bacterium]|nr:hypothetical protein [Chloroflexota bacterium]